MVETLQVFEGLACSAKAKAAFLLSLREAQGGPGTLLPHRGLVELQARLSGLIENIFPVETQALVLGNMWQPFVRADTPSISRIKSDDFHLQEDTSDYKFPWFFSEHFCVFNSTATPFSGFLTHSDIYNKQGLASANQGWLADGFN